MQHQAITTTLTAHSNVIDVWQANTNLFRDADAQRWLQQQLTADEWQKISQTERAQERLTQLVARGMLRYLLGQYLQLAPQQCPLEKGLHGKPQLAAPYQHLQFNVSHANHRVVCTITRDSAIGVDVEALRARTPGAGFCAEHFSTEEQACIAADQQRFYDLWTLKESFVKTTGTGLTVPLNQVCFRVYRQQRYQSNTAGFRSWVWSPARDCRQAVTVAAPDTADVNWRHFTFLPQM